MADENIVIGLKVETGEAAKSLGALRAEYKEQMKALDGLEEGSKAYIAQLQKLGKVKDDIGDLNTTIKAFNPEGKVAAFSNVVGGLASGFQAAQGAAALFGAEGEEVQKMLLKVQAASAFAEGIRGVASLGDGFKVLGAIIKANPLMFLVSILIAIGTVLYSLKDKISVIGAAFDYISNIIGGVIQGFKDLTDWMGLTANAADDLAEAQIAAAKKTESALTERYDNEIKLAKAAGKEVFDLEIKKQQAVIESARVQFEALKAAAAASGTVTKEQEEAVLALGKMVKDANFEIQIQTIAHEKAITTASAKGIEERKKQRQIEYEDELKIRIAILEDVKRLKEVQAAMEKYWADEKKKAWDKELEDLDASLAKEKDVKNRNLAAQAEMLRMQGETDLAAKLAAIDIERQLELSNAELTASERLLITKKYADLEVEARNAALSKSLDLASNFTNSLQGLSDALYAGQLANAKGNAKKELEIKKKQFKTDKALAITRAVIDGVRGVQQAIANLPPPVSYVMAAVNAGLAVANIAKISSQKFEGESGGGGGDVSGVSPGSGGVPINAPSSSSTQLNADGTVKQSETANKVIVVESEITSKQRAVASIEQNAKIG